MTQSIAEPLIGKIIGSYVVTSELGEGGFGVVCAARDSLLRRSVAIKILLPEHAKNEGLAKRFVAEAQAASMIQHPNVVIILNVGVIANTGSPFDGAPYIAMELVNGESLAARLTTKRFTVAETIELGRQVASALAAAHHVGIVHRDLKPANLMLTPDPVAPSGERVKILDFGIAKFANEMLAPSLLTMRGAGTPGYASPEQVLGRHVDVRADIYALGCILHEVASGRLSLARDPLDHVPSELGTLITRMVAFDPQHRPSTMDEVLQALEQARAEVGRANTTQPLESPHPRPYNASFANTPAFRTHASYMAIAATLGIALMGVLVGLWLRSRATPMDHVETGGSAVGSSGDRAGPEVSKITHPPAPVPPSEGSDYLPTRVPEPAAPQEPGSAAENTPPRKPASSPGSGRPTREKPASPPVAKHTQDIMTTSIEPKPGRSTAGGLQSVPPDAGRAADANTTLPVDATTIDTPAISRDKSCPPLDARCAAEKAHRVEETRP